MNLLDDYYGNCDFRGDQAETKLGHCVKGRISAIRLRGSAWRGLG